MEDIVLVTQNLQLKPVLEKAAELEELLWHTVSTRQELKERLLKSKCKLVVLDLDEGLELKDKDIGEDVSIIMLGTPASISKRFSQGLNGRHLDVITKPVAPEILSFKMKCTINRIRLLEEFKKTKRELEKVDKEAEHTYDEWEKTTRILRTSLVEVEKERNELEELNKELERLNRVKSDFLDTVSHELRTPMASIKAFAEILLNEQVSPAEQMEFLEVINSESDRLSRLINNLLTLSRIDAGRIEWEMDTISIDKVITASVSDMKPVIQKKGINFKKEISSGLPYIYGDQDKLVETVINLLSNAVKFTEPGGTIKIFAAKREIDGQLEVWVSVSDTGIGIKPEDQSEVFDKFHQVKGDILTEKPQGSGLGLAICKEIINHHRGRIWVESQYGKGSTFTFSLPAVGG